MATQYEIFLKVEGGYQHVATKESGGARGALDMLVAAAEIKHAANLAEKLAEFEANNMEPPPFAELDTSGDYLIVPTTNATFLLRGKREVYTTEEHDPIHGDAVQQEIS